MHPPAVHSHGRLEVHLLVELQGDVTCEEETVCLTVVVLCSGHVLDRSRKVGSIERVPIVVRVVFAPYLCICRSIDYRKDNAGTV